MKSSRIRIAIALCALVMAASGSHSTNSAHTASVSCSQLEGRTMTLRGKITRAWDNAWPEDNDDSALVLDPKETVLLLSLRRPLCSNVDGKIHARLFHEGDITRVELVLPDGQDWSGVASHIGRTKTIEGTLAATVWWHYEASLKFSVKSIH